MLFLYNYNYKKNDCDVSSCRAKGDYAEEEKNSTTRNYSCYIICEWLNIYSQWRFKSQFQILYINIVFGYCVI
jgi:hypothetical protein